MPESLIEIFKKVNLRSGLPKSIEIRVFSTRDGFPINRRKVVKSRQLYSYLEQVDGSVRVGTFLNELEFRLGAQIGARFELYCAGKKVDGRRSLGTLM